MKMHVTRDWIQKMAALEGDGEIGAGRRTKTIGLTPDEIAELEELALKSLPEWARNEILELRKDKARLDYLDEANKRLNAHYGTSYQWKLIMNHNVNRLMLGHMDVDLNDADANGLPSCRDAIDKARNRFA